MNGERQTLIAPALDDCRHLLDAGKDAGARLENICRLNRINVFVAHRGDCRPTGTPSNFSQIRRLSTPADKDDLRVRLADRRRFDRPVAGSLRIRSSKYILSAHQVDRLADPSDAADQRFVPLFEVDPRPRPFIATKTLQLAFEIG